MNEHEYWQERISRLLDGDLPAEEESALWAHIVDCPECAAVYETYAQMTDALRTELAEPPAELSRLVMARISGLAAPTAREEEPDAPIQMAKHSKKDATVHRLRSWQKVAVAACFVALVAVGAVTGLFGRRAVSNESADTAGYLPEAKNDSFYVSLPENGAAQSARSAPEPEQQTEPEQQAVPEQQSEPEQQTEPEQPQEPEQEQEQTPDQSPSMAEDASPDAAPEADAAGGPALSGAGEDSGAADALPEPDGTEPENGIMTVMEPVPAEAEDAAEPVYIFTGGGVVAGRIEDTGALTALLTGESWQGESPQPLYTLTLNGTAYAFASDGDGHLLWQRAGDAGFTLSPAALAQLQALILQ